MPFYTGRTGSLSVVTGGTPKPVAKIRDWSLDTSVELISTNSIDSVVDTFTPGVKRATGSATLIYYRLEGTESATFEQFTAILGKVHKGGAITESDIVRLDLNVGGGTNDDILLNAYITSAQVGSATGELSVIPIQFTMQGDFLDTITA